MNKTMTASEINRALLKVWEIREIIEYKMLPTVLVIPQGLRKYDISPTKKKYKPVQEMSVGRLTLVSLLFTGSLSHIVNVQ